MGEAFSGGVKVGEAHGATKQEVLEKLEKAHPGADEIRIKTLRKEMGQKLMAIDIARIVHEANRALCVTLGDTSQVPFDEAPVWQKESCLDGIWNIQEGKITSPQGSHESWLEHKRKDGWKYGAVKDAEKKEHPCFVPFDELPPEQQYKDKLFFAIVTALS